MKIAIIIAGILLSSGIVVNAQTVVKHRVLGQDKGRLVIIDTDGKIEWEAPCNYSNHDITLLPNGNVLYASAVATVTEIAPDKTIVWQYTSKPKEGYTGRVEVHAIQRLANGNTMISENGNSRFIEVNKQGTIVKEHPYTIQNHDAHSETRLARLLDNGHYIASHERDATVREYDETGKVVWSYKLDLNNQQAIPGHKGHGTDVYHALRLKNGNTLIAAGSNNRLIEVNKEGKIVWSVERDELPGVRLFWVTSLEVLPNGNIVFGNTHGGDTNPQLIEITHDKAKKVVWTLNNREAFGDDMAAAMVLDVKANVIR
jgi:outer membrane protein assembly factor BamB